MLAIFDRQSVNREKCLVPGPEPKLLLDSPQDNQYSKLGE